MNKIDIKIKELDAICKSGVSEEEILKAEKEFIAVRLRIFDNILAT